MGVGLLIPGIYTAMGWTFLAHPRIGWLNFLLSAYLGTDGFALNIGTPVGMGFLQGLNLVPLAFVMSSQMFRAMNPSLEEAAKIHGLSFGQTVLQITLPLARPAILAACIYIFTIGFAAFDIPAVIGLGNRVYLLSTYIYVLTNIPGGAPDYGSTAAAGSFMIVIALAATWWYSRVLSQTHRYQIVTGKGYRPELVNLSKRHVIAAWIFILCYTLMAKILPFLLLAFVAFSPWVAVPSVDAFSRLTLLHFRQMNWELVLLGLQNTAILMLLVPLAVLILAFFTSWLVVRWRNRFRHILEFGAFLPHVLPDLILAVGAAMFALFVVGNRLPLYGSVWIILLVYVVVRLPFATRSINGPLVQLHTELEEAAHVSGLSSGQTLRKIVAPLLAPTLVTVWIWTALLVYRELTVAAFLVGRNNLTLPVVVWNFWLASGVNKAAAISLIMFVGLMPLVLVWWRFGSRVARLGA
jgi:iron(III) transport system permease protein